MSWGQLSSCRVCAWRLVDETEREGGGRRRWGWVAGSGVHEASAHWGPHVCDCLERKVNCLRGGDGTTEEAEVTAGQMIVWERARARWERWVITGKTGGGMGDCRWGQKDGDVGEVRHWTVGPCCQGDTGLLSAGQRRLQTMGENGDPRFVTFLVLQNLHVVWVKGLVSIPKHKMQKFSILLRDYSQKNKSHYTNGL